MTGVGLMSYYMGLEVNQTEDGIFISQESYTKEIMKMFNILDFLPDILFAVGVVGRFMKAPSSTHLKVARRIFRCVRGSCTCDATEICIDNKSAQALAKIPVCHDRSKHIDTRYHFVRECIAKKEVKLKYVKSHDQAADIFTKPLKFDDFQRLRSRLGMKKKNQN
ncbi:PREDICTED: uncharacterized protein LOC109240856 [Nicotiana attenuata]|uniref:uncharacterized protein LOC109240856 n=1 Tax=Nicotiana attenuata TaxID=49451 RepID=UPI000904D540|nr:PREDICTED: uncharacterized protein LOC109240856 [Nicotiana attenuata]